MRPRSLRLQLVPLAADGHDVAGIGGVGFDLRPQAPDVHVHEAAVAEVVVAPDPFEQHLPAERPPGAGGQLDQQPEFGLGEIDLLAGAPRDALLGEDSRSEKMKFVSEPSVLRARRSNARMRADSSLGANGLVR